MRVLFMTLTKRGFFWETLGIMHLSAMLKNNHHVCRWVNLNDERIIKKINDFPPDIIAISCSTIEFEKTLQLTRKIKRYFNIPIIFGGPHATLSPEIIEEDCIDIVCRGEGEHAFMELVNNMEQGGDITRIKNLWVKKNGRIYRNEVRPLIKDLDSLPFPDRSLYDDIYKNTKIMDFMTSRGCPYNCSNCFNHQMRTLYENKGRYVRRRSVDNVIDEIEHAANKYNFKKICFYDDCFTLDRKWVIEFCEKYTRRIKKLNIKFRITTRADLLDEDIIKKLKYTGCFSVSLGVETGNELTRNNLLKKNLYDKDIERAVFLLRKHRVKFITFNMVGLPGETIDDCIRTIEFNIKLKPDLAKFFVFHPFHGLDLTSYALKTGILNEKDIIGLPNSVGEKSIISDNSKINIDRLAYIYVKYPFLLRFNKIILNRRIINNKIISFVLNIYVNSLLIKSKSIHPINKLYKFLGLI